MTNNLVLVLNCGSSSIKFALLHPATGELLFSGIVQNINSAQANIKYGAATKIVQEIPNTDYHHALQLIIQLLHANDLVPKIGAIGHRIVHGGEKFTEAVLVDAGVLATIRASIRLAPLHNPAHLTGIEETLKGFPGVPQVVVFDTAFHQTMPDYAYLYPIPYKFYQEAGVRRYGFHGTSHRFVAKQAASMLATPLEQLALVTAHLGNGCSVAAISKGQSVDTSMGLTPLEGLMMGTRSGDVDPSLHAYLADNFAYDLKEITKILNQESGLLGVSGLAADMRAIESGVAAGHAGATLAFEIFCYRLAKYIAALTVPLGKLDALVFTGGIGENSPLVRAKTLQWLQIFNFVLDPAANAQNGKSSNGLITAAGSPRALVVPTNEEWLIAQDTAKIAQLGG